MSAYAGTLRSWKIASTGLSTWQTWGSALRPAAAEALGSMDVRRLTMGLKGLGSSWFERPRRSGDHLSALKLSALLYVVPTFSMTFVPLGVPVLISLIYVFRDPGLVSTLLVIVTGWTILVWGGWFLFLRSRNWLRILATGPLAVGLTAGPLYWPYFDWWGPPSLEQIAEQRPPKIGDWEHTCIFAGYTLSSRTAQSALARNQLWLYDRDEVFQFDPTTCEVIPAPWVPRGARLATGSVDGQALWTHSGQLNLTSPERLKPLGFWPSRDLRAEYAVISNDGNWVAWIQDTDPKTLDSPWELAVRPIGNGPASVVRLDLPYEDPHPVRLLAYDQESHEATLEIDYNKLAIVDRRGKLTFGPFRPDGCKEEHLGEFFLHNSGWGFLGGGSFKNCGFRWSVNDRLGAFDHKLHVGDLNWRFAWVRAAAINASGTLAAIASEFNLGHLSQVVDSIVVFRLRDGVEVFRRHTALDPIGCGWRDPVLTFAGDSFFAYTTCRGTQVYEIPPELR